MTKPLGGTERIHTLQLGMSWFPEQAGNGLDRVYCGLIYHLPRAGVRVRGLVAGSPHVEQTSGRAVQAFAPDSASLSRRISALRRMMRRSINLHEFELVASHFALYTFPILDLLRNKPLVIHFHGPWAEEGRVEGENKLTVRAKAELERVVYRLGVRFIVLSDAFREVLCHGYDVPAERIRIVPGGVDVDLFDTGLSRREARIRLGWPLDRPILLAVRRLTHRMGLENLIAAMRDVCERVTDALLYIAGKGPLANELASRIAAANLDHHVKLLGYVPEEELPFAYRAADLSIVPTRTLEGFGLTTVESLAAGTPPLVTPVGGLPEVVRRLSTDLIFRDHQSQTMSDHVVAALRGEVELPSLAACQAYARAHFDWPIIAEQTRRVYDEVLS